MKKEPEYIIPTKKNPVFSASCDWFGRIEENFYKMWNIPGINLVGNTFSTDFADAVTRLHEWIKENKHVLNEYPKSKFTIDVIDGSFNKFGDYSSKVVYTISAAKAKKYIITN